MRATGQIARTRRYAGVSLAFVLSLVLLLASGPNAALAQVANLSLTEAVQRALTTASSLVLAQFTIEEAEIGLEEALIGRLVGRPESEIAAAQATLQEARGAYVDELVRIALEVEEAFYGVIRNEELSQIQQGSLEQANRQLAVAEARYKAGLISRQEMTEAEIAHDQSLLAMERSERQLADAWRQLARLIGVPDDSRYALHNTFGFDPLVISLDDALAEATATRGEIKKAERALLQAKDQVAQSDNAYTAPVTLRKAQMAERRAEIQLAQAGIQVTDSIRREWYGLQDAERNVAAARRGEQVAHDRLAITQARFDAGMISLLDLLRDQAAASQAKLDAAGAVWDYNLAKARFVRSLGRPELPQLPAAISSYMANWAPAAE